MNKLIASDYLLSRPEYATSIYVRGYNGKVSVFSAITPRDAANVLIAGAPSVSRKKHEEIAEQHLALAAQHQALYDKALDEASQTLFGRPWKITDYKISCIGRDEFTSEQKNKLRYHGHSATKHKTLAAAHKAASTSRRIK